MKFIKSLILIIFFIGIVLSQSFPCPFYRSLSLSSPVLSGGDIYILQNLLTRTKGLENLSLSSNFDSDTEMALGKFQSLNNLKSTGVLDVETANLLLELNSADGYKDNGQIPPGFLYKVHIPVYKNRSIETTATLYDADLNVLLQFTVRTHGQNNNATGLAQNEFCNSGNTPTGLMTFDLNSPEPDPTDFGPYPINRAVQGIAGNAFIIISNIRDGILMHTGEWPDWNPTLPMPNSHGCVHGHPTDIDAVQTILTEKLGIQIRNNTFTAVPYLHQPQGILSIELIE
ncbi:hypothetical protein DICPUDRAFT_157221 [Dictyostelium purpureum]|uniref:Uncharacterized protein n=1 Tax=Dictyostelium purpureum TaxID=5786 RepID=F0ZYL0_DICPU|nr:uncharacterized protein DICPUDRAFT_157221 [Dictyostelium purpureum]EGC30978.1 hypothetical protein DICPUDRAFT_157221 [Dictyostelium purpureum]|eukprot:XP_003292505.1 hypothetical protein DICPUDRAFT_157221 [Dictyostelium purpureum]